MLLCIGVMSACIHRPPTQAVSDAQQAIKAAKASGADKYVPKALQSAEMKLKEAEDKMAAKKYRDAKKAAKAAKSQAVMVQNLGSTFRNAKVAVKNATAVNYLWRDTGKILKKAEAAANKGDSQKATKLAKQAQQQAESALNQYYMEVAQYIVRSVEAEGRAAAKKSTVDAAKAALEEKQGKKAYDIAKKL